SDQHFQRIGVAAGQLVVLGVDRGLDPAACFLRNRPPHRLEIPVQRAGCGLVVILRELVVGGARLSHNDGGAQQSPARKQPSPRPPPRQEGPPPLLLLVSRTLIRPPTGSNPLRFPQRKQGYCCETCALKTAGSDEGSMAIPSTATRPQESGITSATPNAIPNALFNVCFVMFCANVFFF